MSEAFHSIAVDITCPKCKRKNNPNNKYCAGCGSTLSLSAKESAGINVEVNDPIAKGLAEWNLEPPQTVVRRRAKK